MPSSLQGDWDWAQIQYETTQRSCDDIAYHIGSTATQVISRASRLGWSRNKVRGVMVEAAAQALLVKTTELEKYEIDKRVFAETQARVLVEHRTDIKRVRGITQQLFTQLSEDMLAEEPEYGLIERTKLIKGLTDCLKTQILLERQAYDISGPLEDPEKPAMPQEESDTRLAHVMAVFAKHLHPPQKVETVVVVNEASATKQ